MLIKIQNVQHLRKAKFWIIFLLLQQVCWSVIILFWNSLLCTG